MEYLKIEGEFPKLANCAVTMGKFDGIHRGHRKLVEKIRERKTLGEQAVLFAIDASSNMILTSQERASLLEKLGVDVLVECQLNDRIRHMKAENFIKEILMGDLGASYVVVGEDNRFGFERKGTPRLLMEFGEKYGFDVEILSKEMDGHRKISSTYIREELKKGNMEKELFDKPLFGRDIECAVIVVGHHAGACARGLFDELHGAVVDGDAAALLRLREVGREHCSLAQVVVAGGKSRAAQDDV